MREGWSIKSLDELIFAGVVELGRGRVISKKDLLSAPGSYPVYSSAKNNDGKFGEYGNFMFDEELITWSVDGGGRLFFRPKHRFSITNVGGYIRIKKPELISYRFLYFCLSFLHSNIEFDWVKKAHPSVIRKLYKRIPLPTLPEQKRIVAILDEAFEGIATAVANTEKNLANARELFESYLSSFFISQRDGWDERQLGDVIDLISGQHIEKSDYNTERRGVGYLTGPADFGVTTPTVSKWTEHPKRTAQKGDILVTVKGSGVGKLNIMAHDELAISRQLMAVRARSINAEYLFAFMASRRGVLRSLSTGAAIPGISRGDILSLRIPVPHPADQKLVADALAEIRVQLDGLERIYQQKVTSLAELKQSLLQKAFSGELTTAPQEEIETALA